MVLRGCVALKGPLNLAQRLDCVRLTAALNWKPSCNNTGICRNLLIPPQIYRSSADKSFRRSLRSKP